ncbi:hypothetical protein QQ045_003762 [Rhodiola kirilowii]
MAFEEKIGQMVQIERTEATQNVMKSYSIVDETRDWFGVFAGSVLSSGGSSPCPNATAEDWV